MTKRYDNYSGTVIPWINEIPCHWEIKRAKYLYRKEKREVCTEDKIVTCFRDGQVTLRENRRTTGFTESIQENGYQHVCKGDLVIHVMDAFAGAIGVSDSDGKCTPVLNCCTPLGDYNNYYYSFLLREMAHSGYIQSLYRGIRERSSDFRFDVFATQLLPVPPKTEQDKIVGYLDWKTTEIDKFILQKKKQIKRLEELKYTKVDRLVSKGINDSVDMNDSNVEWLGKIPVHWEVHTIKQHFKVRKRIAGKEGYDVLSITQQGLKVKNIASNEGQMAQNYSGYQFVYPGDFAMNHMDLITGYVDLSDKFGVTSPDYRVFTLEDTEHCYPEYYLRVFQIGYKRRIFYKFGKGAASQGRWRLPQRAFYNYPIQVPPRDEQIAIENECKKIEKQIDDMVDALFHEIELLQELRTRIIADVVTGQIDVRDVIIPDYDRETIDEEDEIDTDSEDSDDESEE